MKRIAIFLTLAAALVLGACGGESNLPSATGKASIRAINAMAGSSEVVFLIEERAIGNLTYRSATAISSWDDLDYTFNFDTFFPGDSQATRIATQYIDFVTGQDYTLIISGTPGANQVLITANVLSCSVTGSTRTLTLPAASVMVGKMLLIVNTGAIQIDVTDGSITVSLTQGQASFFITDGTGYGSVKGA